MQSRIIKLTSAVLFTFFLTFGLTVSLQSFLRAWTEPSVAPPAGASIPLEGKWENGTNPPEIHYSDGYVGVNTSDPTERLDVDGKIRMRTQTTDADADDILATKAYVDAVASSSGAGGSVPAGAVTAFYQASCPIGWKAADGKNGTPDLRGMFIRGLNDFGTGIRSDGGEDPDGATRTFDDGLYQDDDFESHSHVTDYRTIGVTAGGVAVYDLGNPGGDTTGAQGGNETRPNNVALIYCVREAGSTEVDDALFDDDGSLVTLKNSRNFQVDGKITTSQTEASDSDDTVATKKYVDDNTGSLPSPLYRCPVDTYNHNCHWTSNTIPLCYGQITTASRCMPGITDYSLGWCNSSSYVNCTLIN